MTTRNLILIVGFFSLLNIALFYGFKGNNPTPYSSPVNVNNSSAWPLDPKHKGVTSATLIYSFIGKVTKIEPVGENTRLTLNISDSSIPDFLVKKDTRIFSIESSPSQAPVPNTISLSSIKIDTTVNIGMIYDISKKTWTVTNILLITSTPPPFPISTPSTTPSPLPKK